MLIYRDGSVQINHGGTEMGQELPYTKVRQIAAECARTPVSVDPHDADAYGQTSRTLPQPPLPAGTDLNGAAVLDACQQLKQRLANAAAGAARLRRSGRAFRRWFRICRRIGYGARPFRQALRPRPTGSACRYSRKASTARRTFTSMRPRPPWKPFHYFAYAAAVSEVEVDDFTGDCRLLRTDILEDVGDSISPVIDRGQIEGAGFIQGVGWLTIEELLWDAQGRLATAGASTYKLPSWSEVPEVFNVDFLERALQSNVIFGSKAVGEPPLMLAISVRRRSAGAIAALWTRWPCRISHSRDAGEDFLCDSRRSHACRNACRRLQGSRPSVTARERGEILRAPLFHTPRNPFFESAALESFSDGALIDPRRGKSRRAATTAVSEIVIPMHPPPICAVDFCCRG